MTRTTAAGLAWGAAIALVIGAVGKTWIDHSFEESRREANTRFEDEQRANAALAALDRANAADERRADGGLERNDSRH